jgi:hypothetical protein
MSTEESTAPDSTLEADIDGLVARLRATVE